MFFKIIRFFVITGFACTGTLTIYGSAELSQDTAAVEQSAIESSDFSRFIDAWNFNPEYTKWENKYNDSCWKRPVGFSFMTTEWCISNAKSGSPYLIQKFIELTPGLKKTQKKLLNFMTEIKKHGYALLSKGEESFSQRKWLFTKPEHIRAFNNDPLTANINSFGKLMTHDFIYKALFYMGSYGQLCQLIHDKTLTPHDSDEKIAHCLRLVNTPLAMSNYADLLTRLTIRTSYDGLRENMTDAECIQEAIQLMKHLGDSNSFYNYAKLLQGRKTRDSFDGLRTNMNDAECKIECAALYRKAKTKEAKEQYACMLKEQDTCTNYAGNLTVMTDAQCIQEEIRLYREVNTNNAKYNYLLKIFSHNINESFSGRQFQDRKSACEHIISTLPHLSTQIPELAAYQTQLFLSLAYEEIGNIDEAFRLKEENIALGDNTDDDQGLSDTDNEFKSVDTPPLAAQETTSPTQNRNREEHERYRAERQQKRLRQAASIAAAQRNKDVIVFDVSDIHLEKDRVERLKSWKEKLLAETEAKKSERREADRAKFSKSENNQKNGSLIVTVG